MSDITTEREVVGGIVVFRPFPNDGYQTPGEAVIHLSNWETPVLKNELVAVINHEELHIILERFISDRASDMLDCLPMGSAFVPKATGAYRGKRLDK